MFNVPGSLSDLATLLASRLQSSDASAQIQTLMRRLEQPLTVAVAGREKAGKSTLVNALLHQKAAQTEVGPCTRLVTWYRFDYVERYEVTFPSGRRRELAMRPGVWPTAEEMQLDLE